MIPPADDLDRIMAIMVTAFDPAFGEAWSRRQLEDSLILGNCNYGLITIEGNEPAPGETAAGFFLSRIGVEEEELLLLAVTPQYRRNGLADRLLAKFSAAARKRGALRLGQVGVGLGFCRLRPVTLKVWTYYADGYGRREVSPAHGNIVLSPLSDPAAQVLYV